MTADDSTLMQCTVKKSADVTKKIARYVWKPGLVAGVIALLGYGAVTHYGSIVSTLSSITGAISLIIGTLWGAVTYVPWWVYVVVAIPTGIVSYSMCWCIHRDLSRADYRSKEATYSAFSIGFTIGISLMIIICYGFVRPYPWGVISFAVGDLLIIPTAISLIATDPFEDSKCCKVFRFPGAWYHHHKHKGGI